MFGPSLPSYLDTDPTTPLCPRCGSSRARITTSVTIDYEIAIDGRGGEITVLSELVGDATWDQDSPASCPVCHWYGTVRDLLGRAD